MQLKIEYLPIDSIHPYEKNARKHQKEDVSAIVKSIEQFGFDDPIGIWHNTIVEGHGRLMAAKQLGMTEVPCIRLDHLTDEERRAYGLAHNKTAELSEWDAQMLPEELGSIFNIDMTDFGFELKTEADEDEFDVEKELEEIKEPVTQKGDIYKLGNHYLMCGDSTNEEDVKKLMGGKTADLLVTDPPYNVAVKNSQGMTIENDNMSKAEFYSFITKAMKNASDVLKNGGGFYIWYGDVEDVSFRTACFENKLTIKQCLIWVKNGATLGRQDYQWRHEPCLYGWKEGAGHYFIDDRSQNTVIEDKPDINKMTKEQLKSYVKELMQDQIPTTILREDKPIKDSDHPTMKPLKLIGRLIRNSSRRKEIVLDLFGGSGTTLMACEQLDRISYTMEYDPKYCDVIIKRWEEYTGVKAEKITEANHV